jgi:subtilisin-like proprotein convertase family protein
MPLMEQIKELLMIFLKARIVTVLVFLLFSVSVNSAQNEPLPTEPWAVKVLPGTDINALAAQLGFEVVMPVGSLPNTYLVRVTSTARFSALRSNSAITFAEAQILLNRAPRVPQDDPLYPEQWHLNNTGQNSGTPGADAKVVGAWEGGYTGEGVVVASVDDGVWVAHPDLAPNVRLDLSYDFLDNDFDPSAGGHGTAVAGVMAAADNPLPPLEDYCGVGAAYDAEIAGLRMLGVGTTDAIEAAALSYERSAIHVYNNSWGPFDNGFTLEGPRTLAAEALQQGAVQGRGGLGSIYVWAAGNGFNNDNINADGYANSIYVIAVGASTNTGVRSSFSEPGAAMLINAPSAGGTLGITTTAGSNTDCTNSFGGTSAAAPLAAGVVALILDANPNLTYRDVMHILVNTADVIDEANPDWQTNGAGRMFSHYYGFGRIDAAEAVTTAATWTPVEAQTSYTSPVQTVNLAIPQDSTTPVTSTITVPDNLNVEHVQLVFNATHPSRGQIHVDLTSPQGTVSRMMFGRPDTGANYNNWTMMSVANWGELSAGDWTINVYDCTNDGNVGTFNAYQLIVWGTDSTQPTPTPTATPEPTETPQPPVNLLSNGSFELPLDEGWMVKNSTGDKIKCNKDTTGDGTPDKIFSLEGECAFRFKGVEGERAKLQQNAAIAGVNFAAGDTITAEVNIIAETTPNARIKLIVKYTDDTLPTKVKLPITSVSTGYAEFNPSVQLQSNAVEQIRLSINNKATSGKLFVDDVSVEWNQETGLMPLP